jgi:hypothetical protein
MSVAVELADLGERVAEYGSVALVVSVGDDSKPHVVSSIVAFDGSTLATDVGKTTAANAARHPSVTLLWPAPGGGDYCLIVDGTATIESAEATNRLTLQPLRAVLHRVADAAGEGPSCVTVLDRR